MILTGDALKLLRTLPAASVQCCVTSPPYWGLRNYGVPGQLGLEPTFEEYVARMVEVFREVRRVLRADGTLWLNLGDSFYNGDKGGHPRSTTGKQATVRGTVHGMTVNRLWQEGLKPKDLIGLPWRVAFALQADGWYLRSDIIWHKPNPMPESVTDRPTKAHEYVFLLAKSPRYYYDAEAIKEPASSKTHARYAKGAGSGNVKRKYADGTDGRLKTHLGRNIPWTPGVNPKCVAPGLGIKQNRGFSAAVKDVVPFRNKRTVWTVSPHPFKGAHFATFPPALVEPCILAGCPAGGTVLDPFAGACTTGLVAAQHGREFLGIELNPAYVKMSRQRLKKAA